MIAGKMVTSTIASAAAIAPCIPDVSEFAWSGGTVFVAFVLVIVFALVCIAVGEAIHRMFRNAWSCIGRRSAERPKS